MRIEFKRTGGLSPITDAAGAVELTDHSAEVTSEGSSYQRSLTPQEADILRTITASSPAAQKTEIIRDGFTYEVTVHSPDGGNRSFTSSGREHAPLMRWVQQESKRILAHKVSQ